MPWMFHRTVPYSSCNCCLQQYKRYILRHDSVNCSSHAFKPPSVTWYLLNLRYCSSGRTWNVCGISVDYLLTMSIANSWPWRFPAFLLTTLYRDSLLSLRVRGVSPFSFLRRLFVMHKECLKRALVLTESWPLEAILMPSEACCILWSMPQRFSSLDNYFCNPVTVSALLVCFAFGSSPVEIQFLKLLFAIL